MIFLRLIILLIVVLYVLLMFRISRKLIPELDRWWRRINKFDEEKEKLQDLLSEEERLAEKSRMASDVDTTKSTENKKRIKTILKGGSDEVSDE